MKMVGHATEAIYRRSERGDAPGGIGEIRSVDQRASGEDDEGTQQGRAVRETPMGRRRVEVQSGPVGWLRRSRRNRQIR
jgi:hypothetical protein